MFAGAFSSALVNLLIALLVLAGLAIYLTLVRQISARRSTITDAAEITAPARTFGLPEIFLAAFLILFVLWGVAMSASRAPVEMTTRGIIVSELFFVGIVGLVAAFLNLRGFDIDALAGFSRASLKRAISTGIILLLAAAPLIALAEGITQSIFGGGSSKQEIVDLFNSSQSIQQRVTIIVLAVVVAPISEEFIFRFFIYGVLRRYFGIAIGLIFNALLFAAAHTHLPSALPLFVLGLCFTLAYEWSGSILVSMAMHAFFNSTQLVLLAFPELGQQ
jgi:membrane protease YdiL (CAAX protease family)